MPNIHPSPLTSVSFNYNPFKMSAYLTKTCAHSLPQAALAEARQTPFRLLCRLLQHHAALLEQRLQSPEPGLLFPPFHQVPPVWFARRRLDLITGRKGPRGNYVHANGSVCLEAASNTHRRFVSSRPPYPLVSNFLPV